MISLVNIILWVCFGMSIFALFLGILTRSVRWSLFSGILLLPFSFYLNGAENVLKLFAFLPTIPFFLAVFFYLKKKPTTPFNGYN